jgi:aminoethylphosphonate catabolism LysR family transcriptional regulator
MIQKWLEAFHTVATSGGFTRAAEILHVGQPTVSTHVKSLEDYFRIELFYRHGRTIELTPTGKALATITRGMYGHQKEALTLLHAAGNLEFGQLLFNAVGPFDVMEILDVFRRKYAGISTNVTIGFEGEILEGLRDFVFDIGILGREVYDSDFYCEFYNEHKVLVIAHMDHPLTKLKQVHLSDLEGCDAILRPDFSTTRQAFNQALDEAGVKVNTVMEINSREAAREAVLRGFGIGVVSETEYAPAPSIKVLPLDTNSMHTKAYIVCRKERLDRPLIHAFYETARSLESSEKGVDALVH